MSTVDNTDAKKMDNAETSFHRTRSRT